MKKIVFASVAIGLSLFVGLLVASPMLVSAPRIPAQRESRLLSLGMYVNMDASYGSAELTLFEGGKYTYGDEGSVSAEGTYAITGNQITFIEFGPADAACLHLPGTYTWKVSGSTLALIEVSDSCSSRQYDWKSGAWLRAWQ